ncbi:MAG: hypothetical protein RLZZ450_5516 [Pseudomonadota bacterium]|jgi:hypothetical protein
MFRQLLCSGLLCGVLACATEMRPTILGEPCAADAACESIDTDAGCAAGQCGQQAVAIAPNALRYASGGRRLRAQHYVADGAEKFRGLYDSQLDFACEFVPDVSGAGFRCVPTNTQEVLYLDARCTQPALAIRSGGAAWQSGAWLSTPTAGGASHCIGEAPSARDSYRIGERFFEGGVASIGVQAPSVYAKFGANCLPAPALLTGRVAPTVNRLERVDPATLVGGTLSTLDVGGGLSIQRLVADDDDTEVNLAVLGLGGAPCTLLPGGRCVPEPVVLGSGGFFLDAQCREAAFFAPVPQACGRLPLGARVDGNAARVFELVWTKTAFVAETDRAGCRALNVEETAVFEAGAEVTARFPSAVPRETGTGALHLTRFAAPHGSSSSAFIGLDPGGEFVDSEGHPCKVEETTDGTLRCLPEPSHVHEADHWRDDTCQERLLVADDAAVELPALRLVRRRADALGAIEALYSLVPHTGVAYQVAQTRCVRADGAPTDLLARGEELPLATLARVEFAEL